MKQSVAIALLTALLLLGAHEGQAFGAGVEQYRIGPGDSLSVRVFGEDDLSLEEVRVSSVGTISFPLLGEIKVLGFTSAELEEHLITLLLDGYLKKPKVTVSILKYRLFYVHGEVKKPGGYGYVDGLTIQKAVALAGGFTQRASEKKIKLVHEDNPEEPLESVGLNDFVYPGDVIIVGESLF